MPLFSQCYFHPGREPHTRATIGSRDPWWSAEFVSPFVFGSAYLSHFLTIGVHICTDPLATYFGLRENGLMKWHPSRVMGLLIRLLIYSRNSRVSSENTLVLLWLSNSPLLESGCMAWGLNTLLPSNHDASERAFGYQLNRWYYRQSSSLTSIRIDFYSK
jgi:hypothetical protein